MVDWERPPFRKVRRSSFYRNSAILEGTSVFIQASKEGTQFGNGVALEFTFNQTVRAARTNKTKQRSSPGESTWEKKRISCNRSVDFEYKRSPLEKFWWLQNGGEGAQYGRFFVTNLKVTIEGLIHDQPLFRNSPHSSLFLRHFSPRLYIEKLEYINFQLQ